MKIDQYCQWQRCKHVGLQQFLAYFRVLRCGVCCVEVRDCNCCSATAALTISTQQGEGEDSLVGRPPSSGNRFVSDSWAFLFYQLFVFLTEPKITWILSLYQANVTTMMPVSKEGTILTKKICMNVKVTVLDSLWQSFRIKVGWRTALMVKSRKLGTVNMLTRQNNA